MTTKQILRSDIQGAIQMLDSAHDLAVRLSLYDAGFDLWDTIVQANWALGNIDRTLSMEERRKIQRGLLTASHDFVAADYGR